MSYLIGFAAGFIPSILVLTWLIVRSNRTSTRMGIERLSALTTPGSTLKVMRGPGGGMYLSGVEDLREGDVFRREVRS